MIFFLKLSKFIKFLLKIEGQDDFTEPLFLMQYLHSKKLDPVKPHT